MLSDINNLERASIFNENLMRVRSYNSQSININITITSCKFKYGFTYFTLIFAT